MWVLRVGAGVCGTGAGAGADGDTGEPASSPAIWIGIIRSTDTPLQKIHHNVQGQVDLT